MAKVYKFPWLSMAAYYVQRYLLPDRVHAWIWLSAYDSLEEHMRAIDHHNDDGSRELFDAVSAVRVENLKRKVCKESLKATLVDTSPEQPEPNKNS